MRAPLTLWRLVLCLSLAFALTACSDSGTILPGDPDLEGGADGDDPDALDGTGDATIEDLSDTGGGDTADPDMAGDTTDTADTTGDTADMRMPACGDSVVDPGEDCDDGNNIDGDGCSSQCLFEGVCGNGVVEPGEGCDDGNDTPGDGCTGCVLDTCGDGVLDPGEFCDNGVDNDGRYEGCNANCTLGPFCGDGGLTEPQEECDNGVDMNGDSLNLGGYGGCRPNCQRDPFCGDGIITHNENCDDGNSTAGDGCSDLCIQESGFICRLPN